MPPEPPPSQRPRRSPTNLEPATTQFIGREGSLADLDDLVADVALVTVSGPPGVGKTRLAREYAERRLRDIAPRFPGGVWFVDLAEAKTIDLLLAAVRGAIGDGVGGGADTDPTPESVGRALAGLGRALIVLDDFDGLVATGGRALHTWLEEAPASRFLVTSRERLRVEGEAVFDLEPLSLPDPNGGPNAGEAVALFRDRAEKLAAKGALAPDQDRAIAGLVRALDGLPLAIELAAARTRVLAPTQILDALGKHGEVLRGEAHRGKRAGRTLTAAIEASWGTLTPLERRALAAASVFVGGFDWQAAEQVIGPHIDLAGSTVLDLLQTLRDRSLLGVGAPPGLSGELRFSMLVSVRLFASGKLEAADRTAAFAAHARYYTRRDLGAGESAEGRRRLALERDNLLAVHERALGSGAAPRPLDALRAATLLAGLASSLSYGWSLRLVEAALDAARRGEGDEIEAARGWALEARGTLLRFLGRTAESIEELERARDTGAHIGDPALVARALIGIGNGASVLARWSDARRAFEEALGILSPRGDELTVGRVRTMLASTFYSEDRLDEAGQHLEAALAIQRKERDRSFEGMSVTSVGVVELARGHVSLARAHLDEALAIHHETGNRHWIGVTLGYLGAVALEPQEEPDGEDFDRARQLLEQARALLAEIGVRRAEAIVLGHLGHVAVRRGAFDEALGFYRESLVWHRQTSPDYEGLVLAAIAAIGALRADIPSATAGLERARAVLANFPRPSFETAVELYGAQVEVALARRAHVSGQAKTSATHEARAQKVLDHARGAGEMRSAESRAAERLLVVALDAFRAERSSAEAARDPGALVVEPSGLWFRPPAGSPVRLHRRRSLQRLLRSLVERRSARPGEAVTVSALLESGWPGERVLPEAGQDRVYTAVATLRRMGLREILVRRDDGYLLDPGVSLVCSSVEPT